ncbi:TetR family transcriptional regulator [Galbibacter pacificus]|uniref:Biofilm operon icaADBC HTH-type negative transcriptional regulator IcaR n=1 Tax=Galbibacter pacificus TaxID=2996052 RepID=A0ABT6FW19_9FLAO|nr:TetR family transcriptional regulator [Galbibacter pacificus]MDG3584107.1 TetR family transcriptional regulator [Galbibacter pacificus]MDG3587460.1 TetR family transcriptional regulator [Galbibacter pacificus]
MGRKNLTDKRRKEIIKSFYKVAKKIGLENASIAKVADEMGISNGLVMHYFKTRDDLLIGLNEYILERHLNIVSSKEFGEINSEERLISFIESLFSRKWNRYFDDGVFYSCYALVYRKSDFKISFKRYLESLHEVLRSKLYEARENNVIANTDIEEATEIIFALIDGGYYYLGLFKEEETAYKKQVQLYVSYAMQLLKAG